MSSVQFEKNICGLCQKTSGILTCNGCQQAFCGKHVIEHRQQLASQLENIMQEHDCIQHDINLNTSNRAPFQQIDEWEKEAIRKIHEVANKVRANWQNICESSSKQLCDRSRDIADKLRTAREAEDFSERDLSRWMEELNELRSQLSAKPTIHIPDDIHAGIQFISIKQSHKLTTTVKTAEIDSVSASILPAVAGDQFGEVQGSVIINEDRLCIKHDDDGPKFIYCRGQQIYSQGRHRIRFKIEQGCGAYDTFVGVCGSNINLRQIMYQLAAVVGWLGNGEVWRHGKCSSYSRASRVNSDEMTLIDMFELVLDCEKKQVELSYSPTRRTKMIDVDCTKAGFPWRFLLALRRRGDCVRILPST